MFYYTDANGQQQGPFNLQELQELADQEIIMPDTLLRTDNGRQGKARQIPGLKFSTIAPPPPFQTAQTTPAPVPVPKQLFCTNCGNSVSEQAVACMSCGAKPVGHRKFCRQCAAALNPEQIVCIQCGAAVKATGSSRSVGRDSVGGGSIEGGKSKLMAGLLGILLGAFGVHKFYLGSWGWGIVFALASPPGNILISIAIGALMTFLTVITGGLLAPVAVVIGILLLILLPVTAIIGIIEGIMYLVMSEESFAEKYPPETQSAFRW